MVGFQQATFGRVAVSHGTASTAALQCLRFVISELLLGLHAVAGIEVAISAY
jgi:hypothetical protein